MISRYFSLKPLAVFALTMIVIAGTGSPAQAAVFFNNFGAGDDFSNVGRILEGPDVMSIGDVNQANFYVPMEAHTVESISLGIFVNDSPAIGTGLLNVVVAADAAGAPGAALQTLPIDVMSTGKQIVTATADGSLMLSAGTPYWIIADAEEAFRGSWNFNTIGDNDLTAGQSEPNPWNVRSPDEERYAMRIEGVVPEPSTLLLVCAGLLGFAFRRRRP